MKNYSKLLNIIKAKKIAVSNESFSELLDIFTSQLTFLKKIIQILQKEKEKHQNEKEFDEYVQELEMELKITNEYYLLLINFQEKQINRLSKNKMSQIEINRDKLKIKKSIKEETMAFKKTMKFVNDYNSTFTKRNLATIAAIIGIPIAAFFAKDKINQQFEQENKNKTNIEYIQQQNSQRKIENLKISSKGIDLIKQFESLKLKAYYCPAGTLTIGWGHTKGVYSGQKIKKNEAETLIRRDIAIVEKILKKHVNVNLNQNQYDSLVSFVFNIGETNFKTSTLLKKLNEEDYLGAANELQRWKYAKKKVLNGLIKRRAMEKQLFLSN